MSIWKAFFRQASFKGCPFFVASVDSSYGRKGVHHEFPQRDFGFFEDLGDADPEFSVDGYLTDKMIGGYMAARDALVAACRERGPGRLVHPYRGELTVVCLSCSIREDRDEGGICNVSLKFLECKAQDSYDQPAARADTTAAVYAAADSAMNQVLDRYAVEFGLGPLDGFSGGLTSAELAAWPGADMPSFVSDDIGQCLDTTLASLSGMTRYARVNSDAMVMDMLRGGLDFTALISPAAADPLNTGLALAANSTRTRRFISGALGRFSDAGILLPNALSTSFNLTAFYTERIATLTNRTLQVPADLRALGNDLCALIATVSPLAGTADRAFAAFMVLKGFSLDKVAETTATRVLQNNLRQALAGVVRRASVIEAARLVPLVSMQCRSQALEIRDTVSGLLDTLMEAEDTSDDFYTRCSALRAACVANIRERAPSLAKVAIITPKVTTNSLVQAYELYGDLSREASIIQRNRRNGVRNPALIAGGNALEVLL